MENNTAQIGTNLNGINDWSTQYPFIDFFKSTRDWITHGSKTWDTNEDQKLDLDENGWVKSLNGGEFTSVGTMLPNDDQGRRFVVLYDGEGTIEYQLGAKKDEAASQTGRDVFYAPPGAKLNLRITETDPNNTGDYIRNIRVIPEEYLDIYETQTFNPDFIESLENYKVLRFMDWMNTNDSPQKEWSDRPKVEDANYFGDEGVAVEVLVELANVTGIDPWFTLPHQATDEYVRNFAEYVKENLNPNLNVYVEFSNEVWNPMFTQANYVIERGKEEFADLNVTDNEKGRRWFGKRTAEITQIWDDVFGADKERVIGVLGAQGANVWTAAKSLEQIESTGLSFEEVGIDAITMAPYFGSYIGRAEHEAEVQSWTQEPDGGLSKLFQEITQGGVLTNGPEGGALGKAYEWMEEYAELAQEKGLKMVAYEGGQHLAGVRSVLNNEAIADLFITANRDPRMGEIYTEYFEKWFELGGGLFAHFSDVGTATRWGSWGARESIYQESSPKFAAIQALLTGSSTPNNPDPDDSDSGDDVVVDDPDLDEDNTPDQPDDSTSDPDEDNTPDEPDDSTSDPDNGDTEVPDSSNSGAIVIEAEDLQLAGYKVESVSGSGASGGENITVQGVSGRRGTASGTFEGEAGTYRVEVSYFDEKDGVSSVSVTVAGESSSFDLDADSPSFGAEPSSLMSRVTHEAIQLQPGDAFEIFGQGRQGEHARIDTIKFIPLQSASESGDRNETEAVNPSTPSDGDDNLTGTSVAEDIKALAGNDTVFGGDGDDTLGGGEGDDILNGDGGNDFLTGWTGNDVVNGGSGDDILQGGDGNDLLNGGDDADTLRGGNDADTLNGDGGDDFLEGQAGNDVLNGGEGNDTVGGGGGNDTVIGGGGNDLVTGWNGNDTIIGVDPDAANPGTGEVDTLQAGEGADLFVLGDELTAYYLGGDAADYAEVRTFNAAEDIIQLSGSQSDYTLNAVDGNTEILLGSDRVGLVMGVEIGDFNSGFSFVSASMI
ncbi:calcium-binding protein [Capilliphycus salinus ALCB114379]|uniref:calcium-binding protein n=1 Tax=Capilliphycus salinus TaxID=2768948 RepID=UPI0039A53C2E